MSHLLSHCIPLVFSFFLAMQVWLSLHHDYKVAAEQLCACDLAKYCQY